MPSIWEVVSSNPERMEQLKKLFDSLSEEEQEKLRELVNKVAMATAKHIAQREEDNS